MCYVEFCLGKLRKGNDGRGPKGIKKQRRKSGDTTLSFTSCTT